MDTVGLVDQLDSEGQRLIAGLAAADLGAAVPGTDWDVRSVVVHTGAVHRWATDIVVRELASNETGGSAAFREKVGDEDLAAWFLAGHSALVAALRTARDDLSVFTLMPSAASPRHFWARRQAHETAIHRADVQAAAAPEVDPFDVAFAQDGIAELVDGFAREPQFASAHPGVLALRSTDGPSWLVTFGGDITRAVSSDDSSTATATVTGTSSALYRWAWNRPADVVVDGDGPTIDSWQRIRIR